CARGPRSRRPSDRSASATGPGTHRTGDRPVDTCGDSRRAVREPIPRSCGTALKPTGVDVQQETTLKISASGDLATDEQLPTDLVVLGAEGVHGGRWDFDLSANL